MNSTELTTRRDELATQRDKSIENTLQLNGAIAILNEMITKLTEEEKKIEQFKEEIADKLKTVTALETVKPRKTRKV